MKPVPKIMVSTSCSEPSSVTTPRGTTSRMPVVTTRALGADTAG